MLDSSNTAHNSGYQFKSEERRQLPERRGIQNLDRGMLGVVKNDTLKEEQKVVEYNELPTELQPACELNGHSISKPITQMKMK